MSYQHSLKDFKISNYNRKIRCSIYNGELFLFIIYLLRNYSLFSITEFVKNTLTIIPDKTQLPSLCIMKLSRLIASEQKIGENH